MRKSYVVGCAVMLLSTLILLAPAPITARAQQEEQGQRGGRRRMDVGQRVERLSKELKLTDEQKPKVQALFEDEQKQGQELRQDTSLSREEKRDKMRAMFETRNEEMAKILTADQKKKWDKKMKENRERMRERRGDGTQPEA